MKPIFNSLGSNYSFSFSWLALRQLMFARSRNLINLEKHLLSLFKETNKSKNKKVYLLHKGRDAIEIALKSQNIGDGDEVLTQAFSCHAIEEAIKRTGAKPQFVDLEHKSFNPSIKTLEEARQKSSNPRAVIIQHTLGTPAEIIKIRRWCSKHKLYLIEDLAQAVGGVDRKGDLLGTHADAVVFSFGRDKVVDAVSGGAVILSSQLEIYQPKIFGEGKVNKKIITRDMLYPIFMWLVKLLYSIKVGAVLLLILRKTKLVVSAVASSSPTALSMPVQYASLIMSQFSKLDLELDRRRALSVFYQKSLREFGNITLLTTEDQIKRGANLRFAAAVENPKEVLASLKSKQLYLEDRWYKKPVDCGSLKRKTSYKPGSCPNAEWLAEHVINLPTHRYVTLTDAKRIVRELKTRLRQGFGGRGKNI